MQELQKGGGLSRNSILYGHACVLLWTSQLTIMKRTMLLLLLTASLSSCYHVYYAPNTPNAPLLTEKKEARVNALYSAGGDTEYQGGEIQYAQAVAKNIGVIGSFLAGGKTEDVSDGSATQREKGSGSYFEVGAGYFKAFDPAKKWVGEVYGGTGFGSVKNEYGLGDLSKVNIFKVFIQPAVGYKSPYFEVLFVHRVSMMNWKIKESLFKSGENDSDKFTVDALAKKKSMVAFEPAFMLRGGGKDFKLQAGLAFCNYKASTYLEGFTESVTGSIGISLNFKPAKK